MRSLIQRLAHGSHQVSGTVLAVGAGSGTELSDLRKLGSQRLVLIEAHPQQSEELARRVASSQGEEVWQLAITATPTKRAALLVLNNPRDSSLKAPDRLCRHYPNLRVSKQIEVPAQSLGEAIESLHLDAGHAHLLVLDAPGQAFDLLAATASEALQAFTWVVLRCGVDALYHDDKSLDEILARLQELGFDVDSRDPEAIHPHASILLKRNDSRVRIGCLEAQLQQLDERHAALVGLAQQRQDRIEALTRESADRGAQIARLTQARDEQSRLVSQIQSELQQAALALAEQQKHRTERDEQVRLLTHQRDEQLGATAAMKVELDNASQHAAKQLALIADRDGEIQRLLHERDEQGRIAAQRKVELDNLMEVRATLDKHIADHDAVVRKLTQERDEQTRLASERKLELDQSLLACAELQKHIAQHDVQLQKLLEQGDSDLKRVSLERDEFRNHANTLKAAAERNEQERLQLAARITELESRVGAGTAQSEGLRKELASEKQTASLAVRMQVLREADLKDLRERFQVLSERYESQHQLLTRLGERLNVASNYFHLLASGDVSSTDLSERLRQIQHSASPTG